MAALSDDSTPEPTLESRSLRQNAAGDDGGRGPAAEGYVSRHPAGKTGRPRPRGQAPAPLLRWGPDAPRGWASVPGGSSQPGPPTACDSASTTAGSNCVP